MGTDAFVSFSELEKRAKEDDARTVKERYSTGDDWLDICTLDGKTWILTAGGVVYDCLSIGDARALAKVLIGEWSKGNYEVENAPGIAHRCQNSCEYRSTWVLLSQYRTKAKMTQEELARVSGVNRSQIQKIESGEIKSSNITAKTLIALSGALGIHPIELVDI